MLSVRDIKNVKNEIFASEKPVFYSRAGMRPLISEVTNYCGPLKDRVGYHAFNHPFNIVCES
jgi:hypothetical protein